MYGFHKQANLTEMIPCFGDSFYTTVYHNLLNECVVLNMMKTIK